MLGLLKVFWDLIAAHSIDVYLDRVSTDANPSDGMSRDGEQEAIALGWNIETAKFPEALYKKRDSCAGLGRAAWVEEEHARALRSWRN